MLVVLFGALLHASWNVLVKARPDKHLVTALVYISAALIAGLTLPFLPGLAPASWPYLAASTVTEFLYGVVLAAAYRVGDLSHAYPLMRGMAPLLVAIASSALVGEQLSRPVWIGIALMSCGLFSMMFDARVQGQSALSTALAILNAFLIATYTMIDGLGARKSGQPLAYSFWLFMLTGVPWLIWIGLRRRAHRWQELRRQIPAGLVGGTCSLASYTLALWAMTRAPIAAVAAVRETSIVFGTALAAIVLRERVTWIRAFAATAIAIGVGIIRAG
jgi:drug/metabolite transporter (DMT)-like permease